LKVVNQPQVDKSLALRQNDNLAYGHPPSLNGVGTEDQSMWIKAVQGTQPVFHSRPKHAINLLSGLYDHLEPAIPCKYSAFGAF
jgi:hypothetical protein